MDNSDVIFHYDLLIDENNDPVHDPKPLRDYMDKWDGQMFFDSMQLSDEKTVLEIGVGTGRLAIRTAPLCKWFVGIDISPKTVKRAEENLSQYQNISLICGDFLKYEFKEKFDVIYSSLTFMHINDKEQAIKKASDLLNCGGLFVLSTDKNPSDVIDTGTRKINIYPDTVDNITTGIKDSGLVLENQFETDFGNIFVAKKV